MVSLELENGADFLMLTLFEAELMLDSGDWYLKDKLNLDGSELISDIRKKLALKEFDMINSYLTSYPIDAKEQLGEGIYYERRTSENQELDVDKSIREQFNKFRVCDNKNYPAYFFINEKKYVIKIYKG